MARLLRSRDHVPLGHAPCDPFASGADSPLLSPHGNSDVDFSDVFGGPPRRSSVYQARYSAGESPGWRGGGGEGEEAWVVCRPWSCSSGEKNVFGGVGSPSRRRQVADDFFDDVFRRNESVCSTPRTVERDLFSSNPGSRVLSPARPLPPASDVLGRGSSLPAQLSFPTRLVKGSDHPVFGSSSPDVAYRNEKSISDVFSIPSPTTYAKSISDVFSIPFPTAYAPTNSRRSVETKNELKSGTHASSNESALYRQTCHDHYRSLEATKLGSNRTSDTEMQHKKDSPVLQAYSGGSYFHFSMYKWASIEVTLVMPYNLKERTKSGTKVSGVSAENLQAAERLPDNQCMPQGCSPFHNQYGLEDKSQSSDLSVEEIHDKLTKEVEKVLPASSDTKSVQSDIADKAETKLNLSMSPLDDIDTSDEDGENVTVEAWKPDLQSLPHLHNGCANRKGDKDITGRTRNKESTNIDHTMKTRDANEPAKFQQTFGENTKATQEGKMLGGRVKGKVKEFIKIFNQEPSPRSGGTVEKQARRPRIRNEVKGRLEARVSARVANADEYEKEKVENEALSTAPTAANQNLGIGEEHTNTVQNMGNSSIEGKGISSVLPDSTLEALDASFCNIEEVYIENIDECLVEELPQNQIEVTKADLRQEEIKTSDAKIREWSKGKEGNIRSLLSTLQYVLWPGSGWKPVPLVDIIEGASVRRAYQKALLCLHPDKLQQKGAEMHKKYIAEKVFDILQDAWTHFNSVSSL